MLFPYVSFCNHWFNFYFRLKGLRVDVSLLVQTFLFRRKVGRGLRMTVVQGMRHR